MPKEPLESDWCANLSSSEIRQVDVTFLSTFLLPQLQMYTVPSALSRNFAVPLKLKYGLPDSTGAGKLSYNQCNQCTDLCLAYCCATLRHLHTTGTCCRLKECNRQPCASATVHKRQCGCELAGGEEALPDLVHYIYYHRIVKS